MESRLCGPWEFGTPSAGQGTRTDITAIGEAVRAGNSNLELIDSLGYQVARYSKHIDWIRFNTMKPRSDRQLVGVKVIVLYGPTGTGKTYAAVNKLANQDYHIVSAPSHASEKVWFDGYEGQSTLILDDFNGSWCTMDFLKRLLDVYPLSVEIKGGKTWACWTTVLITTNTPPSEWYKTGLVVIDDAPLRRRIHEIRYVTQQGLYQLMDWNEQILEKDFTSFEPLNKLMPPRSGSVRLASQPSIPAAAEATAEGTSTPIDEDLIASDSDEVVILSTPPYKLRRCNATYL